MGPVGPTGDEHGPADLPLWPALHDVVAHAQQMGFVGPGPLEVHLRHGLGFAIAVESVASTRGGQQVTGVDLPSPPADRSIAGFDLEVLDLGSGGGLPGLVLASRWRQARITLVDAAQRRVDFLSDAAERLELTDRVEVIHGRAEVLGRMVAHRGRYDVVVARSFGPPAVTAECGSPFVRVGGHLVTSEPPPGEAAGDRWPVAGLSLLGMGPSWVLGGEFGFRVVPQLSATPGTVPPAGRYPGEASIVLMRPLARSFAIPTVGASDDSGDAGRHACCFG